MLLSHKLGNISKNPKTSFLSCFHGQYCITHSIPKPNVLIPKSNTGKGTEVSMIVLSKHFSEEQLSFQPSRQ